jgi:hypothetical protein
MVAAAGREEKGAEPGPFGDVVPVVNTALDHSSLAYWGAAPPKDENLTGSILPSWRPSLFTITAGAVARSTPADAAANAETLGALSVPLSRGVAPACLWPGERERLRGLLPFEFEGEPLLPVSLELWAVAGCCCCGCWCWLPGRAGFCSNFTAT